MDQALVYIDFEVDGVYGEGSLEFLKKKVEDVRGVIAPFKIFET